MQPPTPPADAFLMVNHTSLTVRWLPPHSEYGTKIRQYRLDIYQGEVLQSFLVDSKGRNFTLIPFGTSFVSYITGRKFSPLVHVRVCLFDWFYIILQPTRNFFLFKWSRQFCHNLGLIRRTVPIKSPSKKARRFQYTLQCMSM